MKILILAGKDVDEGNIATLVAGHDYELTRYTAISRGVRLLDKKQADLVILAPDANDKTWSRAAQRVRLEYSLPCILLTIPGTIADEAVAKVHIHDWFELGVSIKEFQRSLKHLLTYKILESQLNEQQEVLDWIEDTGRLGSWEMEVDGKAKWSNGIRHIFNSDKAQLGDDFESVRPFVHPDDLEVFDHANEATFEQGWPLDFEYRIVTKGGNVRHLHIHRRVELGPGGDVVRAYGMAQDITPQKEFEHFLYRRDAILQVVGSFAGQFLREANWESGIDDALRELGKAADVTRVFIIRMFQGRDDADTTISMTHEWAGEGVAPIVDNPAVKNLPLSPTFDRWKEAVRKRKTITGHVREFQTSERKVFESTGALSIMIVPVFVGTELWGYMGVSEHREEREWMPVEVESMRMVADMFGSAVLRRRMEDLLLEANKSAEEAKTIALEASKAKSRFLANMSHEIRTPISGILGMAEMTITTGLTSEQREHMDMIRDAARSLLAIVNDVLDISKIEAEKMELKPEDFELRPELDTLVRPFRTQADQKGVVFLHNVSNDIPSFLHGDPDRLGQILRNLFSNALKFTERGLIEMTVEQTAQKEGHVCLLFTVRDTGEGIPKEKLPTIFDSFTQADSSVRKKHQGTGLGLTISKELVQMMGGDIGVDSDIGRGSSFSFTAWFGVVEDYETAVEEKPAAVPQPLHLRILLAEDNPLNQKFLSHFLSMFGHTIIIAENGLEAIKALERQGTEIDLVLMDIQMPEMGGLEATSVIRQSDGKKYDRDIPIIALTAYAMKGDKERMLAAGMDDYVSKPVDMKELSAALARGMENKSSAPKDEFPQGSRQRRDKVTAAGHHIELDMEALIDRFEGNMELLKDILDLFLIEADQKLKNLDAGIKSGDPEELGAAFHSVTNIASHVLSMDIVHKSRELEKLCYLGKMDKVMEGVIELRPQFVSLIHAVKERNKSL